MPTNRSFNLNLIGSGGNNISIKTASSTIGSGLSKGVYLPKSLFTPSSYFSYQSPYNKQIGGSGFDYRRLPPNVDWGLLFNLAVFTIFVCSFFYIFKKEFELVHLHQYHKFFEAPLWCHVL